MSKNIVIQEGGVGRQFTADKLNTALVGGGSCNWVPEDEIQLGIKSITENGTYIAADDGEYGYSQVTVNVSGAEKIITGTTDSGDPVVTTIDVVDGTISEIILGDYFIVTYDDDGNVSKIEDNNGNRCLLTHENETLSGFDDAENNHYTINLDVNGNISQVIDPNAQECELKDRDNDGKIDIISVGSVMRVIDDIETGDIKIIDENDNDVTEVFIGTSITGDDSNDTPWRANITDSTSGGGASINIIPVTSSSTPGASIVGIDSDGDKSVVTIDDNGQIVIEKLPISIEVTTLPSLLNYTDGDRINYAGMVVTAYGNDGAAWSDTNHPNGIIPTKELVLPDVRADIKKVSEKYAVMEDRDNKYILADEVYYSTSGGLIYGNENYHLEMSVVSGETVYFFIAGITNSPQRAIFAVSGEPFVIHKNFIYYGRDLSENANSQETTVKGITCHWLHGVVFVYDAGLGYWSPSPFAPVDIIGSYQAWDAYRIITMGTQYYGGQTISVSWPRPDGEVLNTSFMITVEESEGGGGGGDSPVPAGVTVQDLNIAIYNAANAGLDYIEIDGKQYTIDEAQAMIDYLISH